MKVTGNIVTGLSWPVPIRLVAIGFLVSILAFFPGWMSNDSVISYTDAVNDFYNRFQPPLFAWWWNKLNSVYVGPALMLVQNLLLYWFGFLYLYESNSDAKYSYLIPLIGFWPGVLYPLGQIWKDVSFATSIFFIWGVVIRSQLAQTKPSKSMNALIGLLLLFAIGIKPNGIVVLPFLFFAMSERRQIGAIKRFFLTFIIGPLLVLLTANSIVPSQKQTGYLQLNYTQVCDLLGVSVLSKTNLLPIEVNNIIGTEAASNLEQFYSPNSCDHFYWDVLKPPSAIVQQTINAQWVKTIKGFPTLYLAHRSKVFLAMLRIGYNSPGSLPYPTIVPNHFGLTYKMNTFANVLVSSIDLLPAIYFPWMYLLVLFFSTAFLYWIDWQRTLTLCISMSALCFVGAHFFIGPACDFRYFYYMYFCSLILGTFSLKGIARILISKFNSQSKTG